MTASTSNAAALVRLKFILFDVLGVFLIMKIRDLFGLSF